MNLEEFFKEYRSIIKKKANEDKDTFTTIFSDNKSYTELVSEVMKTKVTARLNEGEEYIVKDYPEYYKIDYTFWQSSDKETCHGTNIYKWNLVAVMEHENKNSDWTYEVAKLDYINAPLKVVIGFRKDSGNEKVHDMEILETQVKNLHYLPTKEPNSSEFGVILMNDKYLESSTEGGNPFDMRCYRLYKEDKVNKVEQITVVK